MKSNYTVSQYYQRKQRDYEDRIKDPAYDHWRLMIQWCRHIRVLACSSFPIEHPVQFEAAINAAIITVMQAPEWDGVPESLGVWLISGRKDVLTLTSMPRIGSHAVGGEG